MDIERPEAVHFERQHRGPHSSVRAGPRDEGARRNFAFHGADGYTRIQGHPRRNEIKAWSPSEPDRGSGVRELSHPERESDRQEGRGVEPGDADPEQRSYRDRRGGRRSGASGLGSGDQVREGAESFRPADRGFSVDSGNDRTVGGGNRRGEASHAPGGPLAGPRPGQYTGGLDGEVVRRANGPAGYRLGNPSSRRVRIQRRL